MAAGKEIVKTFLQTPHSQQGPLLTDDVVWVEWVDGVPPSGGQVRGKDAFVQNSGDDTLRNEVTRLTGEGNVVVAEGICHVTKKDGGSLRVRFCNVFELENGKVKRLDSFGALLKDPD